MHESNSVEPGKSRPGGPNPGGAEGELVVAGGEFVMDDRPFDMWGLRVASVAATDDGCAALLASLNDYQTYGINAVAVSLQGSSRGLAPAFSDDGARLDTATARRFTAILNATRERAMVVVVGLFYAASSVWLRTGPSYEAATRSAAHFLRPWRHVLLNVAGEHSSHLWRGCPYPINDPTAIIRLCEIVAEEDERRIAGGGGCDADHNLTIARSPEARVLFVGGGDYEAAYKRLTKTGVAGKPLVNLDPFGAGSGGLMLNAEGRVVQGAWPEAGTARERGRRDFLRAIEFHASKRGLHLFGHFPGWCEGQSRGLRNRYDLCGQGTLTDPGIRWYCEAVRVARRL